jgi:hypothetical protein
MRAADKLFWDFLEFGEDKIGFSYIGKKYFKYQRV